MRLRMLVLILGIFGFAGQCFSENRQIEEQLRESFTDKLVYLRNPYVSTPLQFDRMGNLLGKSQTAPWTMNGLILVKDIQVRKNRLKLDGTRVILVLGNTSNDQLTPLITGKSMHVIVEDITEATIQQQIYEILSRIFTTDKVEDRFTNYWKPLIDLNMPLDEIKKSRPDGLIGTLDGGRPSIASCRVSCVLPNRCTRPIRSTLRTHERRGAEESHT